MAVADPRKDARHVVRRINQDVVALIEKKYLKQLRDFREKLEEALDRTSHPAQNRAIRIALMKVQKIQENLFSFVNMYSRAVLRVG